MSEVYKISKVYQTLNIESARRDTDKQTTLSTLHCARVQLGETWINRQRYAHCTVSEVYKCLARRDTDKQSTVSIMHGVSAAKLEETWINRQR